MFFPTKSSRLIKSWQWLCTIDEALHHDPAEVLHHRVGLLEEKLKKMEILVHSDREDQA